MSTRIITSPARTNAAKRFVESIQSANNLYYVFASNHLPAPDEQNIEPLVDSDILYVNTYDNILFGKQVTSNDINLVTRKIIWESGEIYTAYDNTSVADDEEQFYVAAQDGTSFNVYKCLDSSGDPSTVSPSGTDLDPIESPVDGYVWKYLYTITEDDWAKFTTTSYMPVFVDDNVKEAAVPHSVEVIKIEDGGAGYSNYVTGAFRLSDLRIGNDTTYAIKDDASPIDDYYQGCIIKMTTGSAAGQYRTVVNYGIVNSKKQITIDSAFTSAPGATDEYEIYPAVEVSSTSPGAVVAKARALISSSGNTVSAVEVLEAGSHHRTATAAVVFHPSVNIVREAVLRPIVSPSAGHGGDIYNELDARFTCVSVSFVATDTVLPHTNGFRSIGVIKNPTFDNVKVFIDQSQTAAFISDESVVQYKPSTTLGSVSISGNTIVGTGTSFDNQLAIGDTLMIANSSYTEVVTISNVSSNTSAQASDSVVLPVDGTGYRISVTANATTGDVSSGALTLETLNNKIVEGGLLYGHTSKATGTVKTSNSTFNAILVNQRDANEFDSFIQLTTMTGSIITGTFIEDERIYQDSILEGHDPEGYVHSVNTDDGIIYASNIANLFELNKPILGETSQAQFNLSDKYNGDLTVDSGEIVYLENILTVGRVENKSETVKLILEF
jgi:hypothetical protein